MRISDILCRHRMTFENVVVLICLYSYVSIVWKNSYIYQHIGGGLY